MPKVKLPTQLREAAGGETAVSVEGATVGAVLDALFERHGELRDRLSDGDGGLRRFVTSTSTARTSASATGSRRRSPTGRRSRSCPPSPAGDAWRISVTTTAWWPHSSGGHGPRQ